MTQEEKDLLLKDLCARLPYDTLVFLKNWEDAFDSEICTTVIEHVINGEYEVKPYLFPLSSMTEEQKKEFKEISKCEDEIRNDGGFDSEGVYLIEIGKYEYEYDIDTTIEEFYFNYEIINWLNKNHFDYIGLIDKGLAIDATGLNIY